MKFRVADPLIVVELMPVTLTAKYSAFDSTFEKSTKTVPFPRDELVARTSPRTGVMS